MLKSCGFTSFQAHQWEVRCKTRCDMLNVTRNHVLVTQKCADTRLLTRRRRHICVET